MTPIGINALDEADAALWRLTREVAAVLDGLPWVLIGGQMVRVMEAEHGVTMALTTGDVDTLLDVRAVSTATEEAAARLQAAHFEPQRYADNLTYRFIRGDDIVDVLAPDHLGERTKKTTVAPDETLEALGGRQALNRRRVVHIDAGDGPFEVPLPSLIGAIVMKARVVGSTKGRRSQSKHERDLARLLALVRDPTVEGAGLNNKERGYLRARADMQ
ncbi:MAG TPA: hypothetical protein VLH81_07600, partial [Desulfobacterales bacterium]|nr:hypothetical protein [Desulfobacterales bacterium]